MPQQSPKQLTRAEPCVAEAIRIAISRPSETFQVGEPVCKDEADRRLRKLRAVAKGCLKFEPAGSPLHEAAKADFFHFSKVYDPKAPFGETHKVYVRIDSVETVRPSAMVAKSLEDFYAGRRSTPF